MLVNSPFWALTVAGAATLLAGAATAESQPSTLSGSIIAGGTTDYVYRGASLNGEKPTAFVYGEASAGMLYVNGLLVGNDLGVDAVGRSIGNLEADLTLGIAPSIGNITFNLGGKYTGYPNGRDIIVGTMTPAERDFFEFFVGAKVNLNEFASVGAMGYSTPNFYYQTGKVRTLELQGAIALPSILNVESKLTSAVGFVHSDELDVVSPGHGYVYGNMGIEGFVDRIYFDLRYWSTDVRGLAAFEPRVALTVGIKFP